MIRRALRELSYNSCPAANRKVWNARWIGKTVINVSGRYSILRQIHETDAVANTDALGLSKAIQATAEAIDQVSQSFDDAVSNACALMFSELKASPAETGSSSNVADSTINARICESFLQTFGLFIHPLSVSY